MAPRIQVDTQLGRQQARPVASPVDQFVQVNPNGPAAQLARALQGIAPDLRRTGLTIADTKNANDREAGQQLASRLALQKKSYEDAVKSGEIPRGANPFFVAGVKEQFGRTLAATMSSDLRAAIGADENMQNSTNVGDFDQFVKDHTDNFLKEKVPAGMRDEFFDAGFQDAALGAIAGQREQFAAGIMDRIEKIGDEATRAETAQRWRELKPDGSNRGEVVAGIQQMMDNLVQHQGRNGTQVTNTVIESLVEQARATHSLEPLDVLKELKGKYGALADTKKGQGLVSQASAEVQSLIDGDRRRSQDIQQQQREDKTRGILSEVVGRLAKNENFDVLQYATKNPDLPDLLPALRSLRENVQSTQHDDVESVAEDFTRRIWNGAPGDVTPQAIVREIGHSLTRETGTSLLQQLDQRVRSERAENANDPLRSALKEPYFKSEIASFTTRLTGIYTANMADGTQRIQNAKAKLSIAYVQWLQSPAGLVADIPARIEYLNGQAAKIASEEEQSTKITLDKRDAAFPVQQGGAQADGAATTGPKKAAVPPPDIPKEDAVRMLQEINSGFKLSPQTQSYMRAHSLDNTLLRLKAMAAMTYYIQQKPK